MSGKRNKTIRKMQRLLKYLPQDEVGKWVWLFNNSDNPKEVMAALDQRLAGLKEWNKKHQTT